MDRFSRIDLLSGGLLCAIDLYGGGYCIGDDGELELVCWLRCYRGMGVICLILFHLPNSLWGRHIDCLYEGKLWWLSTPSARWTQNYISQDSLPCIVLVFGCVTRKQKRSSSPWVLTGVQAHLVGVGSPSSHPSPSASPRPGLHGCNSMMKVPISSEGPLCHQDCRWWEVMWAPVCPRGYLLHIQFFFQMSPSDNRVTSSPLPDAGAMAFLDFSTQDTLDIILVMNSLFHVTHEARDT